MGARKAKPAVFSWGLVPGKTPGDREMAMGFFPFDPSSPKSRKVKSLPERDLAVRPVVIGAAGNRCQASGGLSNEPGFLKISHIIFPPSMSPGICERNHYAFCFL